MVDRPSRLCVSLGKAVPKTSPTAAAAGQKKKMSSVSEMDPTMVGFWDILSDQKACISAKMRGIEVPDMSEMNDMTKMLSSRQMKVKLSS